MTDDDAQAAIDRRLALLGRRWGAVVAGAAVTLLIGVAIPLTSSRRPLAAPVASGAAWQPWTGGAGAGTGAAAAPSPAASGAAASPATGFVPVATADLAAGSVASSGADLAAPSFGDTGNAAPSPGPSDATGTNDANSDAAPGSAPGAPVPLTVTDAAWFAVAGGGTPASTAGIPDGGLPVAARLGQTDKYSVVRLAGTATTLSLSLVSDPGANQLDTEAAVQACAVLDAGWKPGPSQDAASGPKVDLAHCREATRNGTTFTFDLHDLPGALGTSGIALVPAPSAGPAFQVVFGRTAPSA